MTNALGNSAQRAGLGIGQLSHLQGAATLAGVSTQNLTAGMTALNDNISAVASGHAPQVAAAFNYLHVAMRNSNGTLRKSTDLLPELADKLAGIKNPMIQAQLATEIFGGAGDALLPFLRQGSKGIADLTTKASAYWNETAKDQKIAHDFTVQQGELTLATMGLTTALGEHLLPALGNSEEAMANFLKRNKDDIAKATTDWTAYFEAFAIYLGRNWIKRVGLVLEGTFPKLLGGAAGAVLQLLLDPNTSIQSGADETKQLREAIKRKNVLLAKQGLPLLPMPAAMPDGASLSQQVYQQDNAEAERQSAQIKENMNSAKRFFLAQGWTPAQTAGILANASAESGFNPAKVGDNGTSVGMFQWHNDRAAQLQAWSKQNGLDWHTEAAQLGFAQWDLTQGPNKATGDALRLQTDATQAGMLFTRGYERPKDVDGESYRRGQTAPQYLGAPDAAPVAGGTGAAPSTHDGLSPSTHDILTELRNHPGIQGGSGAPPGATSETTVRGSANLKVSLDGFPAGTRTSATTEGDLFASSGPVRIRKSSVGDGMVA
jgi:hypothetical protein